MKRNLLLMIALAVVFLLVIQSAGMLVEAVYLLDLLKTSLDEKALGVLFLFSPALLFLFRKTTPRGLIWLAYGLLFLGRGWAPYLPTPLRLVAAGVAAGAGLLMIPLVVGDGRDRREASLVPAQGLALAVGLSVLLRTLGHGLDLSLETGGAWIGWALGVAGGIGLGFRHLGKRDRAEQTSYHAPGGTRAGFGMILALSLVYVAFSAPAVIARWTQGSYPLVVSAVSLLSLGWLLSSWLKPGWVMGVKPFWLGLWNLAFTLALWGTIAVHTLSFPAEPGTPAVVVGDPAWYQQAPLGLMLLLFPVVFVDLAALWAGKPAERPAPARLATGYLLGVLVLVLAIFMNIFSNVWGYVEPISPIFRNTFWLAFVVLAGLLTLLTVMKKPAGGADVSAGIRTGGSGKLVLPIITGALLLGTLWSAWLPGQPASQPEGAATLTVMTYNIQQATDRDGERAYARQLALIRRVNPDILALQESDSARISLNNNDYVRYFADQLGYYSYYGPKTVTGTFGTALLSRLPLENTQTFFSYSDADEIGTTQAEVVFGGRRFTIFNVHPAGSEEAMLAFARALLERSDDMQNAIALGDFNLRPDEEAYQLVAAQFTNAWEAFLTQRGSGEGDPGENRIDHIFLSPGLAVGEVIYLPAPESATDHPAHWAVIGW